MMAADFAKFTVVNGCCLTTWESIFGDNKLSLAGPKLFWLTEERCDRGELRYTDAQETFLSDW